VRDFSAAASSPGFDGGKMSAPRVAMRKIKECLRLKLECGLSL